MIYDNGTVHSTTQTHWNSDSKILLFSKRIRMDKLAKMKAHAKWGKFSPRHLVFQMREVGGGELCWVEKRLKKKKKVRGNFVIILILIFTLPYLTAYVRNNVRNCV